MSAAELPPEEPFKPTEFCDELSHDTIWLYSHPSKGGFLVTFDRRRARQLRLEGYNVRMYRGERGIV